MALHDQELTGAWRELMAALVEDNKPFIAERALSYAYYWCAGKPAQQAAVQSSARRGSPVQWLAWKFAGSAPELGQTSISEWCRYNFMPLARGTAAVGYMTLLSVFMAAGMPIEAEIPEVPPVTHHLRTRCL